MTTPFMAVGNNELGEETEVIDCDKCGGKHPIEYATGRTLLSDNTWTEPAINKIAGFYKCGDKLYLGMLDGRRLK